MIKGRASPTAGRVASTAAGSKLTVVMVIGSMAGIAVRRRSLIDAIGVARLADDSGVSAG